MANDRSDAANATVRFLHSPEACQGANALSDIAPLTAVQPPSSFFQLLAGEDGVAAGDEVSISYGHRWPAEPYFLLFGFVPAGNPDESVIVYSGLDDLAQHYCSHCADVGGGGADGGAEEEGEEGEFWQRVADRAAEAARREAAADGESGGGGGPAEAFERLVVAPTGLDGRLSPALQLVKAAAAAEARAAGLGAQALAEVRLADLVVERLRGMRGLLVDAPQSSSGGGDSDGRGEARALIKQYRAAKLAVVDAALAAMAPAAAGLTPPA